MNLCFDHLAWYCKGKYVCVVPSDKTATCDAGGATQSRCNNYASFAIVEEPKGEDRITDEIERYL